MPHISADSRYDPSGDSVSAHGPEHGGVLRSLPKPPASHILLDETARIGTAMADPQTHIRAGGNLPFPIIHVFDADEMQSGGC